MADIAASAVIGSVAGIAECTVNQPLIYFKNCLQTKTPISFKPTTLYRGYSTNVATLAPITAIQVSMTHAAQKVLFPRKKGDGPVPLWQTMIAASIAGAGSGLIGGPSEAVILQQQKTGASSMDTLKRMWSERGLRGLFRGTQHCCLRDAGFTIGFSALGPYLTEQCVASPHFNEFTGSLVGGIIAGIFAAVVTHPFDTCKTRFQNDYLGTKYSNVLQVLKDGNPYQGVSARGVRVITGTIIISSVTRLMNKQYQARWGEEPKV